MTGAVKSNREVKTSAIDRHIGARLRTLRHSRGMTRIELGKLIGVGDMQIRRYECGRDRIAAPRLFEIARALGVPLREFFDGVA